MPGWLPHVLCVEAAVWATLFAHLGHLNRHDRTVGKPCARIAAWLLIAGAGFLLMHRATLARPQNDEAARAMRTAPDLSHAPISLQALARDHLHSSSLLPSRGAS